MPRAPSSFRSGSRLRRQRTRFTDTRGAVLIVALIIAALIAVGLASYLKLNLTSTRLSHRSFHAYAALNLAEAGTEEAVWSFNRASAKQPDAWTGWTNNGTSAWQKFTGFDFGRNASGVVKVYVDNYQPGPSSRPRIIAQSSVAAPGASAVTRMLEVSLRRRSVFANALVAKEAVVFSGMMSSVDSWNSDPDNNAATAPVPYTTSIRTDRGTVASTAVVNRAVLINQANIWGYVATGGGSPEVGTGGTIRGADTPAGVAIDPRRIATDFNADFRTIDAPTDGTPLATVPLTLGTDGLVTRWRCRDLTFGASETLTILGDVTLILTASAGSPAISITGNASIRIPAGSRLTIYTEGTVLIAGRGVANENPHPSSFQIWGTSRGPGAQDIQIAGNGSLKAAVYAPFGDIKINGNGDVMGSVIAARITLTGNAAFHYDEALASGSGADGFAIAKWRELATSAERAPYEALFTGW